MPRANMLHARDAHGLISWRDRYLIVVGSWHVESSSRTCEIYDIEADRWHAMPKLNEGTCAPGLVIVGDRYLYKLGGTTDISKVEMLDLERLAPIVNLNKKKSWREKLARNTITTIDPN